MCQNDMYMQMQPKTQDESAKTSKKIGKEPKAKSSYDYNIGIITRQIPN